MAVTKEQNSQSAKVCKKKGDWKVFQNFTIRPEQLFICLPSNSAAMLFRPSQINTVLTSLSRGRQNKEEHVWYLGVSNTELNSQIR
jgi:hypothetical protein